MQWEGSQGQVREALATAGNLCLIKKIGSPWKTLLSFYLYEITRTAVVEN